MIDTTEILAARVEACARQTREKNPLFLAAQHGTFTPALAQLYIENIRLLLEYTPVHLELAAQEADRTGRNALADFFRHKLGEEQGHDQWARDDAKSLRAQFNAPGDQRIVPAVRQMIEYHRSIICDDPKLYLAYILFAEYLIVLGAGEWLALLETRCGIPASSLSAVGNHVELDKDHVTQEMAVLNELVHPEDTRALGEVIDRSADLWDTFSAELCAHEPPLATAHPI